MMWLWATFFFRYDLFNAPMSWGSTFAKQNVKDHQDRDLLYVLPAERRNVNGRYPLGREYKEYRELRKRYPVAKRSPKPIQQKRQVTDPKVYCSAPFFSRSSSISRNLKANKYLSLSTRSHRTWEIYSVITIIPTITITITITTMTMITLTLMTTIMITLPKPRIRRAGLETRMKK